jgi:hypothetical protein
VIDFPAYRKAAIRYWEIRRIAYNLALVPPTLFGYQLGLMLTDVTRVSHRGLFDSRLAMYALGANVCYCFAYVLEFVFGNDDPASRWQRAGRPLALIAGIAFAMVLALECGAAIGARQIVRRTGL